MKFVIRLLLVLVLLLTISIPVFAQSDTGGGPGQASIETPIFVLTPEILAAIAGAALSIGFSYIPGLNTKFAALEDTYKKLIMALLLLIISAALYGLGCGGILQTGINCDRNGLIQLVWIFVLAIMANQSTFKLTPQTNAVKSVKGYLVSTIEDTKPL